MSVLARWCTKHRLVTVVVWLALIIGLGALTGSAGTKYNDTMSIPASESSQAMDLLKQTMPASAGTATRSSGTPPAGPRSPTRACNSG